MLLLKIKVMTNASCLLLLSLLYSSHFVLARDEVTFEVQKSLSGL